MQLYDSLCHDIEEITKRNKTILYILVSPKTWMSLLAWLYIEHIDSMTIATSIMFHRVPIRIVYNIPADFEYYIVTNMSELIIFAL